MTNEIQARVMIRNFECTWSKDQSVVIITCTYLESKTNALSVNTGDHTTSCYAHFPATCIPLCHRNSATVARPSLPRAGDAIHPELGREWSGTRD